MSVNLFHNPVALFLLQSLQISHLIVGLLGSWILLRLPLKESSPLGFQKGKTAQDRDALLFPQMQRWSPRALIQEWHMDQTDSFMVPVPGFPLVA